MEKYFIIESSTKLHKRYFEYIALRDKNDKIIRKFVAENIAARENLTYVSNWNQSFSIVLTDEEYKKFQPQLWKNYSVVENGRMCTFRKDSIVGKLYTKLNIEPAPKPHITCAVGILSAQSRLFDYDGVLYCTINSEKITEKTKFPDGWREISRSEFATLIPQSVLS